MASKLLLGLPAGLALALGSSWAFNSLSEPDDLRPAELHDGPFARVAGREIAYRVFGTSGRPIVLIGGFVEPSWVWQEVGLRLSADHRVVALDLPPFGYSERTGPYTLAQWRDTVIGLAEHLGLDRPTVVGHSLGAAVAVAVALAAPELPANLVLVSGDAVAEGPRPARQLVDWLAIGPLTTSGYRLATRSTPLFRAILRTSLGSDAAAATEAQHVADWQLPFRVAGTERAFAEMLHLGVQGYRLAELADVRVPTHFVWGEHDAIVPLPAGRAAAAAMGAPLQVIEGAGHLPMLTHPQQLAQAIGAVAGR